MLDLTQYVELQTDFFFCLKELPAIPSLGIMESSASMLKAINAFHYDNTKNSDTLVQEYLNNIRSAISNDLASYLKYLLHFTWLYVNEGKRLGVTLQALSCDQSTRAEEAVSIKTLTNLQKCLAAYYKLNLFFREFLFQDKDLDLYGILEWLLKIPRNTTSNDIEGCMLVTSHNMSHGQKFPWQILWINTLNDLFGIFPINQLVKKSVDNAKVFYLRCELLSALHVWLLAPLEFIQPFYSIKPEILELVFDSYSKLLKNLILDLDDLPRRLEYFRLGSLGVSPRLIEDIMNHPSAANILNYLVDIINHIYKTFGVSSTGLAVKKKALKLSQLRRLKSLKVVFQDLCSDKKMEFDLFKFLIHLLTLAYVPFVEYFNGSSPYGVFLNKNEFSLDFSEHMFVELGQCLVTTANDDLNRGVQLIFPILTFIDISISNLGKSYEWRSLYVSLSLKLRDLLEFLDKTQTDSMSRRALYLIISARPQASLSFLYNELLPPCSYDLNKLFLEALDQVEIKDLFNELDHYPEYTNFLVISTRHVFLIPAFSSTGPTGTEKHNQNRMYVLKILEQFMKGSLKSKALSLGVAHVILQLLQSTFEVPSPRWLIDSDVASHKHLINLMKFVPNILEVLRLGADNSFERTFQTYITYQSLMEYEPRELITEIDSSIAKLRIVTTRLNILEFFNQVNHAWAVCSMLTLDESFLDWFLILLEVGDYFCFSYISSSTYQEAGYNSAEVQLNYELLLLACTNLIASSGTLGTYPQEKPKMINLTALKNISNIIPRYLVFITRGTLILPESYFHVALSHFINLLGDTCFTNENSAVFLYCSLARSLTRSQILNNEDSLSIVKALKLTQDYIEIKNNPALFENTELYKYISSSAWFGNILLDSVEPIFNTPQSTIDFSRIMFFNTLTGKIPGRIRHIITQQYLWKIKEFVVSLDHAKMRTEQLFKSSSFNFDLPGIEFYPFSPWYIQLELVKTLLFITGCADEVLAHTEISECKKVIKYLNVQVAKLQKVLNESEYVHSKDSDNPLGYSTLGFKGDKYSGLEPLITGHSSTVVHSNKK